MLKIFCSQHETTNWRSLTDDTLLAVSLQGIVYAFSQENLLAYLKCPNGAVDVVNGIFGNASTHQVIESSSAMGGHRDHVCFCV